MRRRTLLALLPAVLAGCGTGSGDDPDRGSEPSTATNGELGRGPTPTSIAETSRSTRTVAPLVREYAPGLEVPPPGECSTDRPTGPWDDEFEPADYPDPPEEWAEAEREAYLQELERAYVHRLALEEREHHLSGASLDVEVDAIEDGGEVYVFEVHASGYLFPEAVERPSPSSPTPATVTETVTQLPSEVVGYGARYLLTPRFAARSGSREDAWTVVACFDRD